jgi:hypothetical protein
MTEAAIIVAGLELTVLILGTLGFRAFMAWLAQRERERLSSMAEARIEERFKVVDSKLLDLKNAGLARRT